MPRKPRIEQADAIQHVTIRGVNKSAIFRDDADNRAFVQMLQATCERYDWRVVAYCLMINHAHLVVTTRSPNLGAGMQWLMAGHARRCHHRYRTSGHVFQGRYHATLVNRDAYLLEVVRYVLLNPVRAGLCPSPLAWRWSSARETLGLRPPPEWADFSLVHDLLGEGAGDPHERLARFIGVTPGGVRPRLSGGV
jgi:REP element-mobilizing transposase RayT